MYINIILSEGITQPLKCLSCNIVFITIQPLNHYLYLEIVRPGYTESDGERLL